ncbi:hypothetical protein G3578_09175 [Brevibacillus sp. SYP-B805]|uniref:hypothetical protein n=1 Tax=Brevibacillus sp. SYP-B805 TaxID=1578199 RepID=UPI0013EC5012|nr:hypothetical protein [Brevibacillus sp. SYP-B805]NGQ95325.1 hypothetical protein [Brevibacillus sp. SYP-B805]
MKGKQYLLTFTALLFSEKGYHLSFNIHNYEQTVDQKWHLSFPVWSTFSSTIEQAMREARKTKGYSLVEQMLFGGEAVAEADTPKEVSDFKQIVISLLGEVYKSFSGIRAGDSQDWEPIYDITASLVKLNGTVIRFTGEDGEVVLVTDKVHVERDVTAISVSDHIFVERVSSADKVYRAENADVTPFSYVQSVIELTTDDVIHRLFADGYSIVGKSAEALRLFLSEILPDVGDITDLVGAVIKENVKDLGVQFTEAVENVKNSVFEVEGYLGETGVNVELQQFLRGETSRVLDVSHELEAGVVSEPVLESTVAGDGVSGFTTVDGAALTDRLGSGSLVDTSFVAETEKQVLGVLSTGVECRAIEEVRLASVEIHTDFISLTLTEGENGKSDVSVDYLEMFETIAESDPDIKSMLRLMEIAFGTSVRDEIQYRLAELGRSGESMSAFPVLSTVSQRQFDVDSDDYLVSETGGSFDFITQSLGMGGDVASINGIRLSYQGTAHFVDTDEQVEIEFLLDSGRQDEVLLSVVSGIGPAAMRLDEDGLVVHTTDHVQLYTDGVPLLNHAIFSMNHAQTYDELFVERPKTSRNIGSVNLAHTDEWERAVSVEDSYETEVFTIGWSTSSASPSFDAELLEPTVTVFMSMDFEAEIDDAVDLAISFNSYEKATEEPMLEAFVFLRECESVEDVGFQGQVYRSDGLEAVEDFPQFAVNRSTFSETATEKLSMIAKHTNRSVESTVESHPMFTFVDTNVEGTVEYAQMFEFISKTSEAVIEHPPFAVNTESSFDAEGYVPSPAVKTGQSVEGIVELPVLSSFVGSIVEGFTEIPVLASLIGGSFDGVWETPVLGSSRAPSFEGVEELPDLYSYIGSVIEGATEFPLLASTISPDFAAATEFPVFALSTATLTEGVTELLSAASFFSPAAGGVWETDELASLTAISLEGKTELLSHAVPGEISFEGEPESPISASFIGTALEGSVESPVVASNLGICFEEVTEVPELASFIGASFEGVAESPGIASFIGRSLDGGVETHELALLKGGSVEGGVEVPALAFIIGGSFEGVEKFPVRTSFISTFIEGDMQFPLLTSLLGSPMDGEVIRPSLIDSIDAFREGAVIYTYLSTVSDKGVDVAVEYAKLSNFTGGTNEGVVETPELTSLFLSQTDVEVNDRFRWEVYSRSSISIDSIAEGLGGGGNLRFISMEADVAVQESYSITDTYEGAFVSDNDKEMYTTTYLNREANIGNIGYSMVSGENADAVDDRNLQWLENIKSEEGAIIELLTPASRLVNRYKARFHFGDAASRVRQVLKARLEEGETASRSRKILQAKLDEQEHASRMKQVLKGVIDKDRAATGTPPTSPPPEYPPPSNPTPPTPIPYPGKVWLMMGKLASWSPWNWKKTR